MRFKVRDVEYELDDDRLTVAEGRLLKKYTNMGIVEIFDGLKRGDPDSMAAVVFLAKFRRGEQPKWRDLDDINIINDLEFISDGDEGEDDEGGDEGGNDEADPT